MLGVKVSSRKCFRKQFSKEKKGQAGKLDERNKATKNRREQIKEEEEKERKRNDI